MKVLISGIAGFVGSHICEHLLKNTDWEIVGIDSLNYSGNLNRLTDIDVWEKEKHRVKFIYHDLRAPISETIENEIGYIDQIWHLAAESHVDNAIKDPIPFWESNVLGTVNLLNYAKQYRLLYDNFQRFIYFSTDEVFGPAFDGISHTEGYVHNPSNDYSAAKSGAEMACRAAAYTHGLPVTITRSMNILGERQHREKFIPTKVRQSLEGHLTLHGLSKTETPYRCWIHARAVAKALCWVAENGELIDKEHQKDASYGVYHIVGPRYDTYDLAARVWKVITGKELTEDDITYEDYHKQRPGHDFGYEMDGTKLRKAGFNDNKDFWESFDQMIEWMALPENRRWLE